VKRAARKAGGKLPLEYIMSVINDPNADEARRDRLAIAALPFLHGKVAEEPAPSKREQQQEAAEAAATGPFAPGAPPKLIVSNE